MVVPPSVGGGSTFATVNQPSAEPLTNGSGDGAAKSALRTGPLQTASIPLSARHAEPLDLSTVEQRGKPSQIRLAPKRTRPHDIPEAPTFRPTEEEFRDPMEYMHKISAEGRKYGIVKIIPPDSWNPEFAIDTSRFHFRVRRQELNSVEGGTRANLNYLDALGRFHKQRGMHLARFPSVDKRPLDLYKLKKAVEARGGFEMVCRLKKWAEIGRDLGYSGKIMSSLSTSLKNSYQKWLQPYEEYLKVAKPGVQAQLEMENGGPFTPSPGPSPVRKPVSQQGTPNSDHPTVRASAALHASVNGTPISNNGTPQSEEKKPQPVASGFTSVNSGGGFTAVNHAPGFTAVNGPISHTSHPSERSGTPGMQQSPPAHIRHEAPQPNAIKADSGHTLKRQLSNNDGFYSGDDDDRRTKRVKRDDIPTVVGSNMNPVRNGHARYPSVRDRSKDKPGDHCETCGQPEPPAQMLICESCDSGYHMSCLEPQVTSRPDYDWNCPKCLVGTGEFGFEEGEVYSLRAFQDRARRFKTNHFAGKQKADPVTGKLTNVSEDDVEREFWRLVESLTETVEVEYGADIHSTTHGSAFPTIEKRPKDPYSHDAWNLNVLPLYGESLFRHIKTDISGMTVPWLYVGMVFSTFCWHNEDHYAYSANYQHFGDTKTWYGIPAEDSEKFEQAMRDAVPELFETQPDLLFQLVTLLPPEKLRKAGVRVHAIDQRAGEFVITFPQAYHAGFNHGFNFNEAVNFAPTDWEPYGDAGVERLRQYRRQPCFSHDELLVTAAARDNTIHTAAWLGPALERMQQREMHARQTFLSDPGANAEGATDDIYRGPRYAESPVVNSADVEEDDYICSFCKCYSYLSRYVCNNTGRVMCLLHAGGYECCQDRESERYSGNLRDHTLYLRLSDAELDDLTSKVTEKARVPEAWAEKVDALLLDEPRPSLKNLRTLLNEGERIPYNLPRLPDLRRFVDRCNEWVEEATTYIQRKASRRKSDKPGRKSFARQAELDAEAKEFRKIDNIRKLLLEADEISFECPEIEILRERAADIEAYQQDAREALLDPRRRTLQEFEDLLERGRAFNVDMPEMDKMEKFIERLKWREEARDMRLKTQTKEDIRSLLRRGNEQGLLDMDLDMSHFAEQLKHGDQWDSRAQELMKVESISTTQLESLASHGVTLPVNLEVLAEVQNVVKKQREAHEKVYSLCERSAKPEFRERPHYKEARDVMDSLAEVGNKPAATQDLDKLLRKHEDWMRKGKKLFGKTNAPLHILLQHMDIVRLRNEDCFNIQDKPRMPVEPQSRENTPVRSTSKNGEKQSGDTFCMCRKAEAGLMIECEICHEWYHTKCLKVSRGKSKDEDGYKCPVCDWRQKIPRDADRPKLEELIDWQSDVDRLPFQPPEEECLNSTIKTAQAFRDFIQPIVNPITVSPEEVATMRFYLRKVEGADILLGYETNFLRQNLHRLAPVTDEPPPTVDHSGSTRKPRPTKVQKLMARYGVSTPEELPEEHRQRQHTKRRITEALEQMARKKSIETPLKPATPYSNSSGAGAGQPRQSWPYNPPTVRPPAPGSATGQPQGSPYSASGSSAYGGFGPRPRAGTGDSTTKAAPSAAPSNIDPALFGPADGEAVGASQSREAEERMFADMTNT